LDKAEELYQRLIAPIEGKMISIVARIVRDNDAAADVFQEVLATVWAKLPRIDRHPNPHAYILRIALSRSYDALRERARRRTRGDVPLEEELAASPERSGGRPSDGRLEAFVREAVSCLPPKQAQAVLLHAIDDAPYRAIGEVLGCSPVTARSHFSKGAARLKKIMLAKMDEL